MHESIEGLLDLMTEGEALIIISRLEELAERNGVGVHELRFIGHFDGLYRGGKNPTITLEVKLPIREKAWVFAHEMGHLFTITEIVASKPEADLIFGEDKDVICKVELAANSWATEYIVGQLRGLWDLKRAPKGAAAQITA